MKVSRIDILKICYAMLAYLVLIVFTDFSYAAENQDTVNFHLSFENFDFMSEDIVARSEFKTIDDRGLTLEEGRFGKGLKMNLTPSIVEQDEMTGIDLDTVTAVVFNTRHRRDVWVGYNEPFLWGAGKLNPGSGALAFWIKGQLTEGELFNQSAMAWGRKERYLLAITVDEFEKIGAYIRDSRYADHTISAHYSWNVDSWNHIVLNWDKSKGLELFINGESVASSWGTDSWWETPLPGLFHLPMPKVIYDELYVFSKPLSESEIKALISTNTVSSSVSDITQHTPEERNRLAKALGISNDLSLPVIKPLDKTKVLSFKEITPDFMGDGNIPGRFCQDGRYELAWPHPVAVFTIVPGDADFQAEKLNIDTPQGVPYNYVTVEGNLKGLSSCLYNAKKAGDRYTGESFFEIPGDERFFFGTMVKREPHPRITLPFLKGYGAPGEFKGNVRLPLTGETRIHEVGIFDVMEKEEISQPGETTFYLREKGSLDYRYEFAMRTLNPRIDRTTFFGYRTEPFTSEKWIETGYLRRNHIITAPMTGEKQIGQIVLDFDIKTENTDDVLLVRLHDPCLQHRIWTHAEVKLSGFDGNGGRFRLMLDPPPLFLTSGDVIWIDIATLNNAKIRIGDTGTGRIILKPAPYFESIHAYEQKALRPVTAEYTKGYHHQPWIFEKIWPDIMKPHAFGGQFDSIMPAMAVLRVLPYSRLAQYYVEWGGPKYNWGSFVDPEKNFPVNDIVIPDGVPRWAYLQRLIQNFRFRIVDWLAKNQNPDGQIHGGWNDDTLILRGRPDIALDSCDRARDVFLKVYEGLDITNLFGEGFCQIQPIDNVHNGDFVRERFHAVLFKLGDPYIFRRSLETAYHWDKPTPFNWGDGKPFLFDKNILEWYWGTNITKEAYKTVDETVIDTNLSRLASYLDDILFYRFTDARIHTDASSIYNEHYVTRMILGGNADSSISAAWPEGGGEDLARWITYADSAKFECRMFSFDPLRRKVRLRLCRIKPGTYEVKLTRDNDGVSGMVLHTADQVINRFDTISFYVPTGEPVILTVRQIKKAKENEPLPDLAIADYDCVREGGTLKVRVSNVGAARSNKTSLRILNDSGKKITEEKVDEIEAPVDFVEKSIRIEFDGIPETGVLRLVVDPQMKQKEIIKENNEVILY
ncbi:MAG: LamG domain-containing protein [Candidatus Latescibacteria bacterium]|nr:LamG domain-containing protein [Candidatus Latescibacterota bacterium]